MFERTKSVYRAGRAGQPMPAQVDRSIGTAALETGAIVSVFMITVFAFSALGKVAEEHVFSKITTDARGRDSPYSRRISK